MKAYAGIGSRSTPLDIQGEMTTIAAVLAEKGWTLRSGHAEGADWAFEMGTGWMGQGGAEIYLPWPSFNEHLKSDSFFIPNPSVEALNMAAQFHPAWDRVSPAGKKLHARNMHQVLGEKLDDPVKFVLCWTKGAERVGGTAQALRVADHFKIPIFNLADQRDSNRVGKLLTPCNNCGQVPCSFQCANSPYWLDPRREKEDALAHDAMSHSEWFSEAVKQYERVHGEPYVS